MLCAVGGMFSSGWAGLVFQSSETTPLTTFTMSEPVRMSKPYDHCNACKEELLNKKKNPLNVGDECPSERRGVRCEVGCHPSWIPATDAPAGTIASMSLSISKLLIEFLWYFRWCGVNRTTNGGGNM